MPKIEVREQLFFEQFGKTYSLEALEKILPVAKAELDDFSDESEALDQRMVKFELNDTNRPDLWSTAGLARLLREYVGGESKKDAYSQMIPESWKEVDVGNRIMHVKKSVQAVRPFISAFVISGKKVDAYLLEEIIQMQEKLAWNYGRKRKTLSMGIYRSSQIAWPLSYMAVDPDEASFIPLGETQAMTCREILVKHQTGIEYAYILKNAKKYPLLTDKKNEVLSMAPIINSAKIGAVQVGDSEMLIELTGTDIETLLLGTNIVACNFIDFGFVVHPVKIEYEYETPMGKSFCFPFYFQKERQASIAAINKLLGVYFSEKEILFALERMGNTVRVENGEVFVKPAPYRNDFLHAVDIIEDVMLGKGVDFFEPERPQDFTVGKLLPITVLSRHVRRLFVGFGYQEMIFNYLGSAKNFIEDMNLSAEDVIEIANPMSEQARFLRNSVLASLLIAEESSGHVVYPHKIFEIGKAVLFSPEANTGTKTVQMLGFLTASQDANFNTAASEVLSLLYYLDKPYVVRESSDSRFIIGRQAEILLNGIAVGIFGEINPCVLHNKGIVQPCFGGEIILEYLL